MQAYETSDIDSTEGMTNYVDIFIPANSMVDAESELDEPTPLQVPNDSENSDQTENPAPVKPLESQAQTAALQTLAETEYSGMIENIPELVPQIEFPQESSTEFTADTANSELDGIFGDLAALPEANAAYTAPAVEATEGMTRLC